MASNSDKIRILWVWCFCLLPILELIQQAALVNFILFLNILKILKSHFEHFEGQIAYPLTCGLFVIENHVKLLD